MGEDPEDMYGLTRKQNKSSLANKQRARQLVGEGRKGASLKNEKALDRRDSKVLAKNSKGHKADRSNKGRQESRPRRKDGR